MADMGSLARRVRRLAAVQDALHGADAYPAWWREWLRAHPREDAELAALARCAIFMRSNSAPSEQATDERAAAFRAREAALRRRAFAETPTAW